MGPQKPCKDSALSVMLYGCLLVLQWIEDEGSQENLSYNWVAGSERERVPPSHEPKEECWTARPTVFWAALLPASTCSTHTDVDIFIQKHWFFRFQTEFLLILLLSFTYASLLYRHCKNHLVVHIGMYAFDFLISMSYTVSSCTFLLAL